LRSCQHFDFFHISYEFKITAPQGYLHKYSIRESIADGTTLPLFYNLAPNELHVPAGTLEAEFFALAETEASPTSKNSTSGNNSPLR
jgi:type I site-specific restriction-modification system R (restriction) subunit